MNEDKLGEWLDRLEEAKRKSVEQEYPSPVDLHSLSEAREAILAAFAELRAERDSAYKAANQVERTLVNTDNKLHVALKELTAALEREKVLREAVEAVEEFVQWDSDDELYRCLWCKEFDPKHAPDCLRQRALAQGGEPQPSAGDSRSQISSMATDLGAAELMAVFHDMEKPQP